MKAFAHFIVKAATVTFEELDDRGTVRIKVEGVLHEHIVIEIQHVDRLVLK
jgi:hypothetical protein